MVLKMANKFDAKISNSLKKMQKHIGHSMTKHHKTKYALSLKLLEVITIEYAPLHS